MTPKMVTQSKRPPPTPPTKSTQGFEGRTSSQSLHWSTHPVMGSFDETIASMNEAHWIGQELMLISVLQVLKGLAIAQPSPLEPIHLLTEG